MVDKGKAFLTTDWEDYDKRLKEEITAMVTSPDPKDGHTHVAYIDKDGNGMTMAYPENEEEYFQHKHLIVNKKVIIDTNGWSVSFHTSLQEMSEAEVKEHHKTLSRNNDKSAQALKNVFDEEFKTKEGD